MKYWLRLLFSIRSKIKNRRDGLTEGRKRKGTAMDGEFL